MKHIPIPANTQFGLLTTTGEFERPNKWNDRMWLWQCFCQCGTERWVPRHALISGGTRSCGCLRRTLSSQRVLKNAAKVTYTGNVSHTRNPTYGVWERMKAMCYTPNNSHYKNCGAKGIKVDPRWLTYPNFLADVGVKPANKCLWRIDDTKDFGPDNWRWIIYTPTGRPKKVDFK